MQEVAPVLDRKADAEKRVTALVNDNLAALRQLGARKLRVTIEENEDEKTCAAAVQKALADNDLSTVQFTIVKKKTVAAAVPAKTRVIAESQPQSADEIMTEFLQEVESASAATKQSDTLHGQVADTGLNVPVLQDQTSTAEKAKAPVKPKGKPKPEHDATASAEIILQKLREGRREKK